MKKWIALAGAALAIHTAPAAAQSGRTQSGGSGDLAWTATSTVVGQTSTATISSNGNPIYTASQPLKSGVAALIMTYASGSSFICSGSLMANRQSILTAGHCATDPNGARPVSTTAFFYGGNDPDTVVTSSPLATAVSVADIYVNPLYTGQVIDQNDVAVYRLAGLAPSFATAYGLYTGGDLTGLNYTVDGYGQRSDTGGSVGANLGTGRLREGDNRFDLRLGDAAFGGFFNGFFGTADTRFTYLSDFDNGTTANDSSCALGGAFGTAQFCDVGRGAREAGTAGGDSGGPQFVNGQIASVTSFGLVFNNRNLGTDCLAGLQSSCGEFAGFAPVAQNLGFIQQAASVPEPSAWVMMTLGFGLFGGIARRVRRAKTLATA